MSLVPSSFTLIQPPTMHATLDYKLDHNVQQVTQICYPPPSTASLYFNTLALTIYPKVFNHLALTMYPKVVNHYELSLSNLVPTLIC